MIHRGLAPRPAGRTPAVPDTPSDRPSSPVDARRWAPRRSTPRTPPSARWHVLRACSAAMRGVAPRSRITYSTSADVELGSPTPTVTWLDARPYGATRRTVFRTRCGTRTHPAIPLLRRSRGYPELTSGCRSWRAHRRHTIPGRHREVTLVPIRVEAAAPCSPAAPRLATRRFIEPN